MRELLALVQRHLRTTARSRAVRVAIAAFLLAALSAPWWVDSASHGEGLLLVALPSLLVLLVTGFAVGMGAVLPEDRVAGREAWLAALAPPGWKRRLAVVLTGWLLAAGLGLAGGAVAGATAALVHPDLQLRAAHPLELDGTPILGGGEAVAIPLPLAHEGAREVEIDVRPIFAGYVQAPVDRVEVLWSGGGSQETVQASVRGPLRILPPKGARSVQLALLTPRVRLRLTEARRLGAVRPVVPTFAWVGLLLGLFAGTVVPVAVLVSRATTGQTAAGAAFILLLLGSVKHGVLDLAARLATRGLAAAVPPVLEVFARLAPDAGVLDVLAETTARRVPALGALEAAGPALLYTVLVAVLACAPPPGRFARGVNA